ncbi:hypothetical protein I79_026248 [Cricetulus griseus]|uniref:Uncharacterized protein n=1 Tax=Cricetulus griseus TaxID=10029 RepID=G3IQC9_CRIGR|nr:hypothetical protein I79_026248 [Cricetulus griseus]
MGTLKPCQHRLCSIYLFYPLNCSICPKPTTVSTTEEAHWKIREDREDGNVIHTNLPHQLKINSALLFTRFLC